MTLLMLKLPVPARLRVLAPFVTAPEMATAFVELLVNVCAAPSVTGALTVKAPAPLLTVNPAEVVNAFVPERVVAPVPAMVSRFAPAVSPPLRVRVLALLLVNDCAPPRITGALMVVAPAPELTVMPLPAVLPLALVALMVSVLAAPPVPEAMPTGALSPSVLPSTVRLLMTVA